MQIVREKMNPRETAKYIGCSYGFLLSLVRAKAIPSFRIGNRCFFFQDSVDRWLEEKEKQSTNN
jgi:excisionase family DNA binding protein